MLKTSQASAVSVILSLVPISIHAAPPPVVTRLFVVSFSKHPEPVTFRKEGVEVTVQGNKDSGDDVKANVAIRIPGFQTFIVSESEGTSAYFDRQIGIGRLATGDNVPSVLVQTFSGGAHCCAELKAIVPAGNKLKVVAFPSADGEGLTVFPRDLDGDGMVDFEFSDDRFQYAFASHAGSYAPPRIYNIYKGQLIDVSSQPGFSFLFARYAAQVRPRCADQKDDDRNGACAAYVAASSRLGRFSQSFAEADRWANQKGGLGFLPTACSVPHNGVACPSGKEIKFHTFAAALRWFLKDAEYVD